MPPPDKPRHHSGYQREETLLIEAACLTVAVTLGALMDRLCIVGGLAPSLLIDRQADADPTGKAGHAGTNDLDVGLAVALLDEQQYSEIARRLRQENFEPDINDRGNPTPQRWRLGELNVTVDFLMPPIPGAEQDGRVQPLEVDFGALIAPGLELAFLERELIQIDGHTLRGEQVSRIIPVCGPGALIVLKALALADRGEPKDAYDIVYVLRHWPHGITDIADRLARHATDHARWSSAHSSHSPATSPNPTASAPAAQRNLRAPETSTPPRQPTPTGTSTTSCAPVASASCPGNAAHQSIGIPVHVPSPQQRGIAHIQS
jgi:Nucleotidyl transferase AbiEii toxin, Type IV TA system